MPPGRKLAALRRFAATGLLPAFAAAILAGCTPMGPTSQLPPPSGPLKHWYVHESSEEEGKITFRCDDTGSRKCSDQADLWNMELHAAKMCRDWGYDGLRKRGPHIAWTRPTREDMQVRNQTTYRCKKPN